jgi:hypothetical protein
MTRNYINLSDKQLRIIITNLQNAFEENNVDIDDDSELFEYGTRDVIDSVLKYFGFEPWDEEDYTFFIALCRLNKNPEGSIVRPKLETYNILHKEEVIEYKTVEYSSNINAYIPLNKDNVYSMGQNDLYFYYEGKVLEEQVDETEHRDDYIENITKLKRFD